MSGAVMTSVVTDKRRREMVTPEGVTVPITVASRGARIGALMLDFTILFFGFMVFNLLMIWIFGGLVDELVEGVEEDVTGAGEFLVILYIIVLFLARYAYFLVFELGPRGATLGKRITGIRIATRDGGRLTAEAVIARNLLRDIELFMPLIFLLVAPSGEAGSAGLAGLAWFLLFMAFPFFNKDAMRAGDVIAGTWVVEAPRAKLADTLSTQGGATGSSDLTGVCYEFGERELSIYGEHELQTLERVLRDGQQEALVAVHDTICRKIGWNPGAGDERAFLEAYYAQLRARLEGDMRFGKRKRDKFS
ncbi:RDD family protein [Altererythrobacter arenosus]|uniref:RDD family protein n=1 Tax=Altererythrobacter arenosus TaxID=3032592 RepID=A0ABY8FSP8_9SPHN|nr:RDD family protein [Altererythrobacter sp. CAU 1644]WFL76086.1 RDD family protein [Altererythrobacter sp. CAU 1644]